MVCMAAAPETLTGPDDLHSEHGFSLRFNQILALSPYKFKQIPDFMDRHSLKTESCRRRLKERDGPGNVKRSADITESCDLQQNAQPLAAPVSSSVKSE
ncbi:hypothetical protein U0070_015505 [Myodes glareolus]|uniref:Uncharacterized protein n=1 Tax=Myodes glareolus TaxID=447135 RepID=A0AAW0HKX0_MYOGA